MRCWASPRGPRRPMPTSRRCLSPPHPLPHSASQGIRPLAAWRCGSCLTCVSASSDRVMYPSRATSLALQAWKSLALRLHPDKNPDKSEKGQAAYARVQKAYELLTDKAARAALDDLHRCESL